MSVNFLSRNAALQLVPSRARAIAYRATFSRRDTLLGMIGDRVNGSVGLSLPFAYADFFIVGDVTVSASSLLTLLPIDKLDGDVIAGRVGPAPGDGAALVASTSAADVVIESVDFFVFAGLLLFFLSLCSAELDFTRL